MAADGGGSRSLGQQLFNTAKKYNDDRDIITPRLWDAAKSGKYELILVASSLESTYYVALITYLKRDLQFNFKYVSDISQTSGENKLLIKW